MTLWPGIRIFTLIRRSLTVAILFGVLLVPATCANAAGPHSLYVDPREPAPTAAHRHHAHAGAAPGAPERHGAAGAAGQPAGRQTMSDLPATMLMSIASSTIFLTIPQVTSIPSAQSPEPPVDTTPLRGTPVRIDVPPPRAGMLAAPVA
jgi:hypothetical protein